MNDDLQHPFVEYDPTIMARYAKELEEQLAEANKLLVAERKAREAGK